MRRRLGLRRRFRAAALGGLRRAIVSLLIVVAALPTSVPSPVAAADYYWDSDGAAAGNSVLTGVGLGGSGTWDAASLKWWNPDSPAADVAWPNRRDTALFWGTAGPVALGANINVGDLAFNTTGYVVSTGANVFGFGSTNGTITLNNIAAATITGGVVGNNISLTGGVVAGSLAGTLTLNGSSGGGWLGTTTINTGTTLALAAGNQALVNTTAIKLNGGALTLTNVNSAEGLLDRVNNSAPITVNSGTITYANTNGFLYNESLGAVDLRSGQLNIVLTVSQTTASQTLTLAGLTQFGTATAGFAALTTAPNATTNRIVVTGAAATTGGNIIGPWATTGTTAILQTDYATYDSGGRIIPLGATPTADASGWGTVYASTSNVALNGTTSLLESKVINTLRYTGAGNTLGLDSGNLSTYGILSGGTGILTISGVGTLSTPTGGGNIFFTGSGALAGGITISAPITDNGGSVGLVVGSNATVLLSGTNSFTGGVTINSGLFTALNDAALGGVGSNITINGPGQFNIGNGTTGASYTLNRSITINNGALPQIRLNGIANASSVTVNLTGPVTGSGGFTYAATSFDVLNLNSVDNTFAGPINMTTASTGPNVGVTVASLADSPTANGSIRLGPGSTGTAIFGLNTFAIKTLTLDNRAIELPGVATAGIGGGILSSTNGAYNVALIVNTDLVVSGLQNQILTLTGTNLGANAFAGKIIDTSLPTSSSNVSLSKTGAGTWSVGGNNPYTGTTTITAGILQIATLVDGGLSSNIGASTNSAANLVLAGGTLRYLGAGSNTDRLFSLQATSSLESSGAGALNFTNTGLYAVPAAASARTLTLTGTNTGNNTLAGVIQNSGTAANITSVVKTGGGQWILTGVNTYTGSTTVNGGTLLLDASATGVSTAALAAASTLTLGGGTFALKGNDTATVQNLGALTLATGGGSQIQVVGGATGTALAFTSFAGSSNGGVLNISVSGTNPSVQLPAATTNGLIATSATGRGGAITFTSGGTTKFATIDVGKVGGLTIATPLPLSGNNPTVNYILTGDQTQTGATIGNVLQINNTSEGTLTLGPLDLTLTMGGLLYTGSAAYTLFSTSGVLKSGTATNSDLMIHNFGTGGLNVGANIANGLGTSLVTLDGPGTTTLSGVNSYTGGTVAGGGATLSISANYQLGGVAIASPLTLNNATLQTTTTFGLFAGTAGTNDRPITLGPGGGTFEVTDTNTLTVSGLVSGLGTLTKTGTGTLRLLNANTYTGLYTSVQKGTLVAARAAGALPSASIVTLGAGAAAGVLQLGDATTVTSQTIAALRASGSAGATNAVVGGSASVSTLILAGTSLVPSVFTGTLGGNGANNDNLALAVLSGSLTLSADNTFSGGTTLSGGTLNLNGAKVLGSGSLTIAGGMIDNTTAAALTLTGSNPIILSGASGFRFGGTRDLNLGAGPVSLTNPTTFITLGGSGRTLTLATATNTSGADQTLWVDGENNTLTLAGFNISNDATARSLIIVGTANVVVTGTVANGGTATSGTLVYGGSGTLRLVATNTFGGAMVVNSGIVVFGSPTSIGGSGTSLTVALGAIATPDYTFDQAFINRLAPASSGTVALNGNNAQSLDFSAGGANAAVSLGAIVSSVYSGSLTPNGSTYRFGGGTANLTIAGVLADNGGPTGLVKIGLDTVVLASANTFTGPTTSNSGTLLLNAGNALQSSVVTVGASNTIAFGSGIGAFRFAGLAGSGSLPLLDVASNPITLTIGGNNASTTFGGTLTGTGGSLAKTGTGTLTLSGANTFTGGLVIRSGIVLATTTAQALGTGSITLGEVGNSPASLIIATTGLNITNPIVLATGATGLLTLGTSGTAVSTTFSGGVTGVNDFTINGNGTTGTITFSTSPINNAGAVNLASLGSGATTISGGIGSNVTQVNAASSTSALTISTTPLTVNPLGTTVTNSGNLVLTFTAGTTGSGDLTLTNNNTNANGITISTGAINHNGRLILAGTSTTATAITAPIGTAVTGVSATSATSAVTISGGIDAGGGIVVSNAGPLVLTVNTLPINGTGDVTFNADGSGNITVAAASTIDVVGKVNNSGAGTGQVTISSIIGPTVTGVVQNSATSQLTLAGANTFTSNLTVLQGIVAGTVSSNAFGTNNTIILGAPSGSNPATITSQSTTGLVFPQSIVLGGSTGLLTIAAGTGINATTYSGSVTGTNDLVLGNNAFNSGILTLTGFVNNVGKITGSGVAVGVTTLSGGVGSNVTQITLPATSNSPITISTNPLSVNSAGTLLLNNGSKGFTFTGGSNGTGDLTFTNNSPTGGGFAISTGALNNTGKLIFNGTSAIATAVSAAIGAGVTSIDIDTPNSTASLTGAIDVGGGLVINTNNPTVLTIGTGVISGTGDVVFNTTGGGIIQINGANTYVGNTSIPRGTVGLSSVTPFGDPANIVTLGLATGSEPVTVTSRGGNATVNQAIVLNGTGGTITLAAGSAVSATLFTGGVTGNNDLTLANNANASGTLTFSNNPINIAGKISIIGSASSGATTISGGIGSNVTQIAYSHTLSALTISTTPITVNAGGTTLINTGGPVFLINAGVNGTGDLILRNNVATAGGVALTVGTVNNAGVVVSSGTGTGATTISAPITGGKTTGVTQASNSSQLNLSSTVTLSDSDFAFTSSGTALLNLTSPVSGPRNLSFVINSSGLITQTAGAISNAGTVNVSGTGTGVVSITGVIGSSVLGVNQNSATALLILSGPNTFSTGVNINAAGTVRATVAGALGSALGRVSFNAPGTLNLRAVATGYTTGLNLSNSSGTVTAEPASAGPAVAHTLSGSNLFGSQPLTFVAGDSATSGTASLILSGTTTLIGPATFIVNQSAGGVSALLNPIGTTTAGGNSMTLQGNTTAGGVTFAGINYSTQAAISVKAAMTGGAPVTLGAIAVGGRSFTFENTNAGSALLTTGNITVAAGTNPVISFAGSSPTTTGTLALAAGNLGNRITNTNSAATSIGGVVTLNGPTTITNSSSTALSISSITAGSNPLVFNGSGDVSIGNLGTSAYFANTGSGNVTVTGQTTPAAGVLISNTGTGSLTFASYGNILSANITGTSPIAINNYQMLIVAGSIINTNTSTVTVGPVTAASIGVITLTLINNGGTLTFTDGLQYSIAGTPVAGIAVSGTGTTILNGAYGGNTIGTATTGGVTVSTTGTGSLTLGGTNLFTGVVTLSAGSLLKISSDGNLGANATATRLTSSGGTLQVTDNTTLAVNGAAGITLNATSFFNVDSGKTLTINQQVTLAAQAIFTAGGSGNVVVGSTGSILLNGTAGFNTTGTGSLTINGNINGQQNLTFAGSSPITINGSFATGTSTIAINGNGGSNTDAGALTFNNANTGTGTISLNVGTLIGAAQASGSPFGTRAITISAGTLQLNPLAGNTSTTAVGLLTTSGGATVKINATAGAPATTFTFTGALTRSGAGSVVTFDPGSGALNTEAIVRFGTAPTPANGIIPAWATGKTGATSVDFLTYNSGLELYTAHTTLPLSGGSATVVYKAAANTELTGNVSAYALRLDSGVVISALAATTPTLTIGGTTVASVLLNGTGTQINSSTLALAALEGMFYTGGNNSIAAGLTGSAGYTVYGPGTLTLSGNNAITGAITINQAKLAVTTNSNLGNNAINLRGTLQIAGTSAFTSTGAITVGPGGGTVVVAGGNSNVQFGALTAAVNAPLTLTNNGSGTLTFAGATAFAAGTVRTTAGNVSISGAYTATAATNNVLLVTGGATTLSYTGSAATLASAAISAGTLVLNTPNLASTAALSNLTINGGTVKFGNDTTTPTATTVSALLTMTAGTLDINGFATTIARLAGTGGTITNNGAAANTLTVNVITAATAFAGVIQDGSKAIGLTIGTTSGFGLTLSGANTYTGTTTINSTSGAGGIVVGNPNALATTPVVNNVVAGATGGLSFAALSTGLLSANIGSLSGPGLTVAAATTTFNLNLGTLGTDTLYSGSITTGLANSSINKVGAGNMVLGGLSTYLGYTSVNVGSLELGVHNALPATTILNVAAGSQFRMNDFNLAVAGLFGSGTIRNGTDFAGSALTISGANTSIFAGSITGFGGLAKSGAGTATFTGSSTYTGTTRVTAGTLNLDFSVASPASSILAPTTPVVLSGGTLVVTAPMTGTATQALGAITIAPGVNGQIGIANTVSGTGATLNLGQITRGAGSILTLALPTIGTNTITTPSFGTSGLIVDAAGTAFAVINTGDWAAKSGNSIVPATYSSVFGVGLNTDLPSALTAGGTTASLRFNQPSSTLTLSANSVLTSGGILVTTIPSSSLQLITGNFNLAGPDGGEFVIIENGGSGNLRIDANLVDGGLQGTGLTKIGTAGALVLTGNNTYSGTTTLLSGTLVYGLSGAAAPTATPSGPFVNFGSLQFNTGSGTMTINQVISGTGAVTNVAGNVVLTAANTFSGITTITLGTMTLTNSLALQNSVVTPTGGTLAFSGITTATFGALATTVTPAVALPSGFTLVIGNNNAAASYTGALTGSGSLTKIGAGTQTFSGVNTYTGTTTIGNGGVTLTFPTAADSTGVLYNGVTAGPLVLGGLSGGIPTNTTLTVTGATTAGRTSTQNFANTTLAANSGAVLTITATASTTVNVGLGNAITRNVGSLLAVTNALGATTRINYTGGTANTLVRDAAGTAFVIIAATDWGVSNTTNTGIVPLGSATTSAGYTLSSANANFTAGANMKVDSATATWAAGVEINSLTNTLSTIVTVGGTVGSPSKITTGGILQTGANTLTFSGGVIQSQSNELVLIGGPSNVAVNSVIQNKDGTSVPTVVTIRNSSATNSVTFGGVNTYTGATIVQSGLARFATVGNTTLSTSAIMNNGIVGFTAASGTQTVNSVISGTGAVQIGGATVEFGAANTYLGTTTITAGTARLLINNGLPTTTALTLGILTAAGTLDLNGFNQTIASFSSTGTQAFAGSITNQSVTADSILTFGDATNQAFNAVISDGAVGRTVALVKQGSGTQTFQGVNTFTGGVTINAGTVNVVQLAKLSGIGKLAVNAGTLALNTGAVEAFGSLSGSSTGGLISLAPGTTLSIRQTADADFFGSIVDGASAGDGRFTLAVGSTNVLAFKSPNYYSGVTTIAGGTLSIAAAASLGDGSATNTIAFSGGTLRGTSSFTLGATRTIALGAGGGTIDVTGANVVSAAGAISGNTPLRKSGTGTFVLATTNLSFTGQTFVNGGTLVAGSTALPQTLYNSSAVNVGVGAVLIGAGSTLGTLNVAGTISPGTNDTAPTTLGDPSYRYDAIGSFAAQGGVSFANGSTFTFQFLGGLHSTDATAQLAHAGTDWDLLQSLSTIDLGIGVVHLKVVAMTDDTTPGANPTSGSSLQPFAFNDPLDSSFHWLFARTTTTDPNGITYDGSDVNARFAIDASQVYAAYGQAPTFGSFYVTRVDNNLYLNYAAVPEPGSITLSVLAGLALLRLRKKRRSRPKLEDPADPTVSPT